MAKESTRAWYRKHYNAVAVPEGKTRPTRTPPGEAAIKRDWQNDEWGEVRLSYYPTASTNPSNPRTVAAGYDSRTRTLRVEWGDGGPGYYYYGVPSEVWERFKRTKSPGRFINSVLNQYEYGPHGL